MLTAALIVLLVLIALLSVPITLDYRFSWQRRLQGEASLQWLFGLVRIPLKPSPKGQPAAGKKRIEKPAGKRAKPKKARKKLDPLAALRQKAFRRRILRFVREVWQAFRKRDVQLRIRIGLGDPADTGRAWALFGPLSGLLSNIEEASVELEADFVEAVFELDSRGNVSVVPLRLIYILLCLLLSPPFWRGMRRMRRAA
ncbi:MAG: DUF2953 domain-containing protein [Gammaproteobacteria bacterium]|jgi:hypothetical protein